MMKHWTKKNPQGFVPKALPLALLLAFGAPHASAEIIAAVCGAGTHQNACVSGDNRIDEPILTIRGFAFDPSSKDSPTGSGHVIITNVDSGQKFKIPIVAAEGRPDVVANHLLPDGSDDAYLMAQAGFIARVFTGSLPTGRYSVDSARVGMRKAGLVILDLHGDQKASFSVNGATMSGVLVENSQGESYPLTIYRDISGKIRVKGYPAFRDGEFSIHSKIGTNDNLWKSVQFNYKRPVVEQKFNVPIAEGFFGIDQYLNLLNPLNNKQLQGALNVVIDDGQELDSFSVDGNEELKVGDSISITQPSSVGSYRVRLNQLGDEEKEGEIKLFVDLPDAPNIVIKTASWHPGNQVKTSTSKPSAAIKVENVTVENKVADSDSKQCLSLYTIREGVSFNSISNLTCAIRWEEYPEGMKYDALRANSITGPLLEIGENFLSFVPGVIAKDPDTRLVSFYPGKKPAEKVVFTGVEPELITLAFAPDKTLLTPNEKIESIYPSAFAAHADADNRRSAGVVTANAAHRRIYTKLTYPDGEEKSFYSGNQVLNTHIQPLFPEPWEKGRVKVESWYELAPEYKTEKVYDFVGYPGLPIILVDKNANNNTSQDVIITGQLGTSYRGSVKYDRNAIGDWQIDVFKKTDGTAFTQSVKVDEEGNFSINLGKLSSGTYPLILKGQMLNENGDVVNDDATKKDHILVVERGSQLTGRITSRESSGRITFSQVLSMALDDSTLLRNIGSVNWEFKGESSEWERIKGADGEDLNKNSLFVQHDESGIYTYRAITKNKFSGEEFVTEPYQLQAYNVPDFTVVGPGAANQKSKVEFSISSKNDIPVTYQWKIISGGKVENVEGENTDKFSFIPQDKQNYLVEVVAIEEGAPESRQSQVTKRVSLRVVDPLIARATISGPKYVEAGKTYTYTARIVDVVGSTVSTNYNLKGYWSLPDGSKVDGPTLDYTVSPGDKNISYYTYIEGEPERTSVSTYTFASWVYEWPSNWEVVLKPLYTDVPARIKYQIKPIDKKLSELNGEPLEINWSLPNGVTRQESDAMNGYFDIDQHGLFQIAAQVSDTRGNAVNVSTNQFSILPAAEVETTFAINSKFGELYYAPGTYSISLKVNKLPRGDSFLRNELVVNGEKVSEFSGSTAYLSFVTEGQYDIIARTLTKLGNVNENAIELNVKSAPEPVCNIDDKVTNSGRLFTAGCTVDVGYIKGYLWEYTLDGEDRQGTSKSFVAMKAWINEGRISNLRLTVETDMGKRVTENVAIHPMP